MTRHLLAGLAFLVAMLVATLVVAIGTLFVDEATAIKGRR